MTIYFDDEQTPEKETLELMKQSAALCLENEGIDPENVSISVSFVDKEEIQSLNKEYRGVDSVTDVLSFPQFDADEDFSQWEEIELGDVVICMDRCREQAEEFGHSEDREVIYLFTHSILHLLGYDHMEEDEKKEMREREEAVMTALNLKR